MVELTAHSLRLALRQVLDPELDQNIVDLGLLHHLQIGQAGEVVVTMTLTTPHCPMADRIMGDVRRVLLAQPGVTTVDVRLVWDPPWTPYRMADHLKEPLGLPDREPPPPQGLSHRGFRHRLDRLIGRWRNR